MKAPSRRGLLAGVAALVPGVAVAAIPAAAPAAAAPTVDADTEIHALCARFHHLDHQVATSPDDDPEAWEQAHDERWDVTRELQPMRPQTPAGRLAKAGVALALMEENTSNGADTNGSTDDFVLATLRDVMGRPPVRLVGEATVPTPDDHPSQLHTILTIKGGMPDPVFERWLAAGLRMAARHKGGLT